MNYSHITYTCPQMDQADREKYSCFTEKDLFKEVFRKEPPKDPQDVFLGSKRHVERWGHYKNDYPNE